MTTPEQPQSSGFFNRVVHFCLEERLFVTLMVLFFIAWGFLVAPFDWQLGGVPRTPVPVDAIPDIGENQQIVFTEWPGRSPQDVEDQVTYPLTISLLGLPQVKTVRSYSYFGYSSIFIIFREQADYYDSRSRILEKLNSLPEATLPEEARPMLGPDATALGQIFWYTLEGRDQKGQPTGGWDLHEIRSVQDWYVRYGLLSAEGVSEVASIGGFVQEYQIDVDPNAMLAYGVSLEEVFQAVKMSNRDVGARTIEVNKVEYVIRGLGFIKKLEDLEMSVIKTRENVPIYLKDVAEISRGPALRMGVLDKAGAEAVGGVVVVRYGENPLQVIQNVKKKIKELEASMPEKILPDGTKSRLTVVPFYDRTGLIHETLNTLNEALALEILVTILVVMFFLGHFGSSILIAGLLPFSVLLCFIAMKLFGVDANVVALSGIAIAIGTMVDMGIVMVENIVERWSLAPEGSSRKAVIRESCAEVGGAVMTAVATTVVGFLPVFSMQAAEGKLFKPLAYTKTFALVASLLVALTLLPAYASIILGKRKKSEGNDKPKFTWPFYALGVVLVILLTRMWLPLGVAKGLILNLSFVVLLLGSTLFTFYLFQRRYLLMLAWCLENKRKFLLLPLGIVFAGVLVWLGFDKVFGFVPKALRDHPPLVWVRHSFPGLGREFMPSLDEGSFLFMPTTMPHASIGEAHDILKKQDKAIQAIPEVEWVVGKIGRAESSLDPAPVFMMETLISYKSEYVTDEKGKRKRFKYDRKTREFVRDNSGELVEDRHGRPYRQWREQIRNPDDIWREIARSAQVPGSTAAPKLQPIATRLIMLQTGMRAPMGVKVKGPDLESIEQAGLAIEEALKQVPLIEADTVIADRISGKAYLKIEIDREAIARYGVMVGQVQDIIEIAIGGNRITTTVEGRERYPVRVRYLRELRDSMEALEKILIPTPSGAQVPLEQMATIHYLRGPEMIKSEDTFLIGYVIFDKKPQYAEGDVVEAANKFLRERIDQGLLVLPEGVSFHFAGNYENEVRSTKRLALVLPLALFLILLILYFQFHSFSTTLMVFSGVFVAGSGGFLMLWLYGQDWFLNFYLFGVSMRDLFQIHPVNLSVAVWVGFLALFGIATDDGVVFSTYLKQAFSSRKLESVREVREAVLSAGARRIRPCLMTTVTTILALLPVLTSSGRGSDVMVPMAIPSFGGMVIELMTVFIVPVLYCAREELKLKKGEII